MKTSIQTLLIALTFGGSIAGCGAVEDAVNEAKDAANRVIDEQKAALVGAAVGGVMETVMLTVGEALDEASQAARDEAAKVNLAPVDLYYTPLTDPASDGVTAVEDYTRDIPVTESIDIPGDQGSISIDGGIKEEQKDGVRTQDLDLDIGFDLSNIEFAGKSVNVGGSEKMGGRLQRNIDAAGLASDPEGTITKGGSIHFGDESFSFELNLTFAGDTATLDGVIQNAEIKPITLDLAP